MVLQGTPTKDEDDHEELNGIIECTSEQVGDDSREWFMLRRQRVTTSSFGEIIKRRKSLLHW